MKTFISIGDFIDVYHKIKQEGLKRLFSKLKWNPSSRVANKWDFHVSQSDFWLIPEVQQRWNTIITGNPAMEYEDYVIHQYLYDKSHLKMLSIGCGEGYHDRKFAKHPCFSSIEAIDISPQSILQAQKAAHDEQLTIHYQIGNFKETHFEKEAYDVILFDSSLHHFDQVALTLEQYVKPLLKKDGILVVFEYAGPNRLQWRKAQLNKANALLHKLPRKYRISQDNTTLKNKVYRPGLLRMLLVDPSEAVDSESIVSGLNTSFTMLEQKDLGWNILHILLKGIAHNFINDEKETKELLSYLFAEEDKFIKETQTSDAIFGVYKKGN